MRADRLISILLLLQMHERLTTHQLSQELGVSRRTIQRDMEALSTSGVPVFADRGNGGGWSLLDDYRVQLNGLKEPEIQALFLSQPTRIIESLGLKEAFQAATIKLLTALPERARRDAELTRQRLYIDGAGWFSREEAVTTLPHLQEAIWESRRCQMWYQRSDDELIERIVEPLGLVAKGTIWYLVAQANGEARTYRISRIQKVIVTEERFSYPDNFNLTEYWKSSVKALKTHLPRYVVNVLIRNDAIELLRTISRYAHIEKIAASQLEEWLEAEIDFETIEEALSTIFLMGEKTRVIQPKELRDRLIELAKIALNQAENATQGQRASEKHKFDPLSHHSASDGN